MTTRAIGYVRVSLESQVAGHSLDAQRRAITDACRDRGYTLLRIEADEGISARSERIELRPALCRVLDTIDRAQADVLIVHSLDRLARNVLVMLQVFRRLADHRCAFLSLTEAVDYTSAEGRLQLTILGAFASYFSDSLAKHVTKGKAERAARGYHNNRPPYGYILGPDKSIVLDPATADHARALWQIAARGGTLRTVCEAMSARGVVLHRDTVRNLLHNRTYLGEVSWRRHWHPGRHPALTDPATFALVQSLIAANRRSGSPALSGPHAQHHVYPLGGLLSCAGCGGHLGGHDHGRAYCCSRHQGLLCRQRAVYATSAHEQFGRILARLDLPDDEVRAALADRQTAPAIDRAAIDRRLRRLRDLYEMGDMERAEYVRKRDALQDEMAAADAVVSVDDVLVSVAQVRDLAATWADATPRERSALARMLVMDMLVDDRQIVAVKPVDAWAPLFALAFAADAAHPGYLRCGND